MLAVRYLTEEWAELALERVESGELSEALHGVDVSILAIVLHPPEGCYGFIYVSFEGGTLMEYRVGYDYDAVTGGLGAPTFVVSGAYEVFAEINRGELSERKAILSGKLHLTGSVFKALRHMGALEKVTAALMGIPCDT